MKRQVRTALVALLLTLGLAGLIAVSASAVAPLVAIEDANSVSYTTAQVAGTVDPQGEVVNYRFQYISDVRFQENLASSLPGFEGASPGPEGTVEGSDAQPVSGTLEFLSHATTYHVRLLAETGSGESAEAVASTFTTLTVDPPAVTIEPIVSNEGSAHFEGVIDPQEPAGNPSQFNVSYRFECTPSCPVLTGASGFIAAGEGLKTVEAEAEGLAPNTTYEVRLVAENAGGPASAHTSFATAVVPPLVQTLPPAVVTDSTAWIGGKVNPRNSPTTYYIEYATDPTFSHAIRVLGSAGGDAGAGNERVFANYHAPNLLPGTTYYYRVVAIGAGISIGASERFTTRATPPNLSAGLREGRVYEKVSPADKNGGEILPGSTLFSTRQSSPDGNAVAYASFPANFGGAGGNAFPQYVARRGPLGWTTEGVNARMEPRPVIGNTQSFYWFSSDLTRNLVNTPAQLNPGDQPLDRSLYVREAGRATQIIGPTAVRNQNTQLEGVSADERHYVFRNRGNDGDFTLWEWVGGQARAVSVLPDGTLVAGYLGSRIDAAIFAGGNAVSADGTLAYFTADDGSLTLYLRDFRGTPTTTEIRPDSGFELASADGDTAFFKHPARANSSLFRFQADAPAGSQITNITAASPNPRVLGTVGSSDSASAVYFTAEAILAPGAVDGAANLYLWRQGRGLSLVAVLRNDSVDKNIWSDDFSRAEQSGQGTYRQARVTPDGRYLSFVSQEALTAYDTDGTPQMYLFDAASGEISCVSCSWVEPKASGGAWFSSPAYKVGNGQSDPCCDGSTIGTLPRNLAEDGSRIVFDSNDRLLPGDTDGVIDVYQWKNGELSLLSTGNSSRPSQLLELSPDGHDIFFTTSERLVPADQDSVRDLYDARVGGRPEAVPPPACRGEECQGSPSAPPGYAPPASSAFNGAGNTTSPKRCKRGKRLRKGKCVRKRRHRKHGHHRKQARHCKHRPRCKHHRPCKHRPRCKRLHKYGANSKHASHLKQGGNH